MKKVFTFKLLALTLLLLVQFNLHAQQFIQGDLIYEMATENTAKVIGLYNESATHIDIPSSVVYNSNTHPITSIGDGAFANRTELINITIGDRITSIGKSAFSSCYSLKNITIPNGITSIEDRTFQYCGNLTNITIPNSIISIGDYAFQQCRALTNVTIPNSVTSIGEYVFYTCTKLTDFNVSEENTKYSSSDGVLFNKDKTILVTYPSAKANFIYTIPITVTSIGASAFATCTRLTSITIPNSTTSIGKSAFSDCKGLTSITIPNSITSIGNYAFSGCSGLKEIHCLSSTPPSVSDDSFYNINSNCILYVPRGSYNAYRNATVWKDFKYIFEEDANSINDNQENTVKIYTKVNSIIVQDAEIGADIFIYSQSGILIKTIKATDTINRIELSDKGVYIIRVANQSFKVIL